MKQKLSKLTVIILIATILLSLSIPIASASTDKVEAFVTRLYNNVLQRNPDKGGLANWVSLLKNGTQTGASVAYGFFFSEEMKARNLSSAQFVDILYTTLMDRTADSAGRASWLNHMSSGMTRERVFEGFVMSPEFDGICKDYGIVRGEYKAPSTGTVPTPPPTPPASPVKNVLNLKSTAEYKFTYSDVSVYDSYGSTYWKALIEVENISKAPLYFGSSKYDLVDKNGKILRAGLTFSSFPDILHPGEKGYLYDMTEVSDANINTAITMTPRWDIRQSKEDRINFNLSDIEIRDGQFGTTVYGRVKNSTGVKQTWAEISVVLYAHDKTPIGVWFTNVMEDMAPGATIAFEISAIGARTLNNKITPDTVAYYVAYAYPPQWQF